MTRRDPLVVLLLGLITCGIYIIVWYVQSASEMNRLGANIPSAILLFIPFANLYWFWQFAAGVEQVTQRRTSAVSTFLLMLLCGVIGIPLTVQALNTVARPS